MLVDLSEVLIVVYGMDFGVYCLNWILWFFDMVCQVVVYCDKCVLLVGDVVYVYLFMGGQGLNMGMQDVVNFGWKLVVVIK